MNVLMRDERATAAEHKAARPGPSDAELLQRFVTDHSDLAFAQLVTRYGPLVIGVCRRILGQEQDAEDAFQATFLVLARKAASLRCPGALPAWLHKTAYRVALRAKTLNVHRREQKLEDETMIAVETLSGISSDHDQSALDEELNRLPDRYRLPLFLCCVEGVSRNEAASRLGWSVGSLKGRLERGRQLLRRRLMLRGVSLSVAMALLIRTQQTAQAAVPPALVASTVQAGMQYAVGKSVVAYVSQNALSLANRSLYVMSLTTSKVVLCSLVVVGLFTWGTSWLPAPAIAGSDEAEEQVVILQTDAVHSPERSTLIAFLADDQGDRPRRSPEADAGPRRSPEAEAGPRRSAEAKAGPRRSAEGDARRALGRFRPQTQREAALYQMILQLQREVAQLRQSIGRASIGERADGDQPISRRDPVSSSSARTAVWENTKAGKVFKAYDKNGDTFVTLDEWLAMTNGNINAARRESQTKYFREAEPSGDGKFTPEEFVYWYTKGRFRNVREGRRTGVRDGQSGQRGPRDGERAVKRGPRDGEGGAGDGR